MDTQQNYHLELLPVWWNHPTFQIPEDTKIRLAKGNYGDMPSSVEPGVHFIYQRAQTTRRSACISPPPSPLLPAHAVDGDTCAEYSLFGDTPLKSPPNFAALARRHARRVQAYKMKAIHKGL